MTPPRVDVDKPMRLKIVRHLLADSLTLPEVAAAVGLSYEQVLDIANRHGYPDERRMTKAVEMLQDGLENDPPRPTPPPRRTQPTKEDTVPDTPEQDEEQMSMSALALIVSEGRRSSNKRTVTLAERVAKDSRDLLDRVRQERAEAANAARIAELQAEIDRLRAESGEQHVCRVVNCGHRVRTLQGLNAHRTREHGLPGLTPKQYDEEVAS